ncbi:alkaline phosphatase family protein [soil metagenome]
MALVLLWLVCALPAAGAVPGVPSVDHIIVVVFENKNPARLLGSPHAPTFTAYAKRHAKITRYYGVTHPSLPNYLALVSGSTHGIKGNCTGCVISARTLADTIEASGRTWKTYAEGLPRAGWLGAVSGRYAKKHNPFVYFRNIAASPARRAHVVPFTYLTRDLQADRLPHFSLIVPDMCNSMHDCSLAVGDAWLRKLVPKLVKLPNTAIFILFDEGTTGERGGGHIPAIALGMAVKQGVRFTRVTDHYGALRTIEEAWGLPLLGGSAQALPITGIWRESAG